MKRMLKLAALMFASALPLSPVFAQTSAPTAADQVPALDPALLEKARPIAAAIFPEGTYVKMMGPMMQKIMAPMFDSLRKMPIKELARAGGQDPAIVDKMSPATLDEIMTILDPAYHDRIKVMMESMFPALGRFMSQFEPEIRDGMSEAFAGRYSSSELDDINAFLRTPSGSKFGSGYMGLMSDPRYISRVQAIVPKMMQAMPAIMQESTGALAKLPKQRKYKDLSQAERLRLAEVLGIDPKKMKP